MHVHKSKGCVSILTVIIDTAINTTVSGESFSIKTTY